MKKNGLWIFIIGAAFLPYAIQAMDVSLEAIAKEPLFDARVKTPSCGLILSHAVNAQKVKNVLCHMHLVYRVLRKKGLSKDVAIKVLDETRYWQEAVEESELFIETQCLSPEQIYGRIAREQLLNSLRASQSAMTLYDIAECSVKIIHAYIRTLIDIRWQALNRIWLALIHNDNRAELYTNGICRRQSSILKNFEPALVEFIIQSLYGGEIRKVTVVKIPGEISMESQSANALNNPATWGATIETILNQVATIESTPAENSEIQHKPIAKLDRKDRRRGGALWLNYFKENGFSGDPTFPHRLLENDEYIRRLTMTQKEALLIIIFLADIEQLLHAYFHMYGEEQFERLVAHPHDTIIEPSSGFFGSDGRVKHFNPNYLSLLEISEQHQSLWEYVALDGTELNKLAETLSFAKNYGLIQPTSPAVPSSSHYTLCKGDRDHYYTGRFEQETYLREKANVIKLLAEYTVAQDSYKQVSEKLRAQKEIATRATHGLQDAKAKAVAAAREKVQQEIAQGGTAHPSAYLLEMEMPGAVSLGLDNILKDDSLLAEYEKARRLSREERRKLKLLRREAEHAQAAATEAEKATEILSKRLEWLDRIISLLTY